MRLSAKLSQVQLAGLAQTQQTTIARYTPHCDEEGKYETVKYLTENKNIVALSVSNCAAIEIVDDTLKILKSNCREDFEPYVLRSFWKNGQYFEQKLSSTVVYDLKEVMTEETK